MGVSRRTGETERAARYMKRSSGIGPESLADPAGRTTGSSPAGPGSAIGRGTWVLTDQALASASNFGITVLVARTVSIADFGIFGLILAIGTLAIGVVRGVITQPLTVRFAGARAIDHASASLGGTVLLAAPIAALVVAAGLLAEGEMRAAFLAFALVLPFILCQDTIRFIHIANGTPKGAALNDLIWCVAQVAFLWPVVTSGNPATDTFILAWGAAAAVATVLGVLEMATLPSVRAGYHFVRRHLDLGTRLAAEFFLQAAATQVTVLLLAVQVGTEGAGAIRGSQTLLGVYFTIYMGVVSALLPEAARLVRFAPERLPRLLGISSGALGMLAVLVGILLLSLPTSAGEQLLGETWIEARSLLVATTVGMVALGVAAGGFVGLRVLEAVSTTLRIRAVLVGFTILIAATGAATDGAQGAAWGLAIGHLASGVAAWTAFGRHYGRRAAVGAAGP